MNKYRSAAAMAVLLALSAFAPAQVTGQPGSSPVIAGQRRANRMVVEREILGKLNLTADQTEKVKGLVKQLMAQTKANRQATKASGNTEAGQAQAGVLRAEYEKSLSTILSPAQFSQYKQLHKEYRAKMKAARAGLGAAPSTP